MILNKEADRTLSYSPPLPLNYRVEVFNIFKCAKLGMQWQGENKWLLVKRDWYEML